MWAHSRFGMILGTLLCIRFQIPKWVCFKCHHVFFWSLLLSAINATALRDVFLYSSPAIKAFTILHEHSRSGLGTHQAMSTHSCFAPKITVLMSALRLALYQVSGLGFLWIVWVWSFILRVSEVFAVFCMWHIMGPARQGCTYQWFSKFACPSIHQCTVCLSIFLSTSIYIHIYIYII